MCYPTLTSNIHCWLVKAWSLFSLSVSYSVGKAALAVRDRATVGMEPSQQRGLHVVSLHVWCGVLRARIRQASPMVEPNSRSVWESVL